MLRSRGGVGYGYVNPQGYGGYVKGILNTHDELKVYVYAGQCGIDFYQYFMRFNGGGATSHASCHSGGAGGGGSDIRLIGGPWNNSNSLKSRIIVAGGGGGAQSTCGRNATAGHGGNLTGGTSHNQNYTYYNAAYSTGGTQVSGGYGYCNNDSQYSNIGSGGFGYGANSNACAAGGGGGWYGGGTAYTSGGGGGSSYAAGYPGCNTSYLHSYQKDIALESVEFKQGVNKNHGYVIITCLNLFEYRKNTNIYDNISHNISDISFLF